MARIENPPLFKRIIPNLLNDFITVPALSEVGRKIQVAVDTAGTILSLRSSVSFQSGGIDQQTEYPKAVIHYRGNRTIFTSRQATIDFPETVTIDKESESVTRSYFMPIFPYTGDRTIIHVWDAQGDLKERFRLNDLPQGYKLEIT